MKTFSWMASLSVWLAFSMTSFLVASRVSLLWLLRLYKYEQIHPATWYLIVMALLQVPYISNLIHLLWNTPIISAANRESLPKASHVALGVLSSVLEAVASSIFATEVVHVLPEPVLLTLPYSTLAFHILRDITRDSQLIKSLSSEQVAAVRTCEHVSDWFDVELENRSEKMWDASCMRSMQHHVFKFIGFLVACYTFWVATAVGVVLTMWSKFRLTTEQCVVLSTSVLLLSCVWSPTVQRTIMLSHKTGRRCTTTDLLYIPIKVLSVFVTLFLSLFFKLEDFRTYMTDCVLFAVHEFSVTRIWLSVVICCFSAFLAFMTTAASSKVCLINPGMKIPMFLCPVLAVIVTAVLWNDFETQAFWEVAGEEIYSWAAIGLSAITWLIPFIVPGFRGFKSPKVGDRDMNESFYSFSWNAFFLEPRSILNYSGNSVSETCNPFLSKSKTKMYRKKTVFICSTMYKESDKEMKRYLRSIQNVFAHNDKEMLNVEAHVFFDSSVHNDQINPRGRHLLSLLCEMFGVEHGDLQKLATPYGCQVLIKTVHNYSVYIHFKDTAKVKAKKRWSQVMYMHYVLQFRNSRLKQSTWEQLSPVQSQTIKQCQDSVFHVEHEYSLLKSSLQHLCGTEATDSFLKYSRTPTNAASDVSRQQTKDQTVRPQDDHDVQDSRCYCGDDRYSNEPQENYVHENTDSNTAPFLTRMCRPASPYLLSGYHLWMEDSSESVGPRHTFSRRSSFSNDKSDRDCSSSSDAYSSKTYSSLKESASKACSKTSSKYSVTSLDDVFLLTTDADTEFSAKSIMRLLKHCESDPGLGAVCGRTVPVGSAKPIVWYQKFEYAKDFWLVKSSQNVIGSVTCCPGCFSIYRGTAVARIAEQFSQPACSAFDSLVMDHGEDRWLCTLLMQHGWRLAYSSHAHNSTHCPETVGEFLRQRRRWVLSELSNMAAIFMSVPSLVRNNSSFSGMFLLSLFTTFLWVIVSPSTTLVFMCAGFEVLFSVSLAVTLPVAISVFIGYCGICCLASQRKQKLASLTVTFAMALTVVTLGVGFINYVVLAVERDMQIWGSVQFRPYFLVFLMITSILYATLLHPRESLSLIYGLAYALLFPAMFVVLPGYALSNMLDQSWGTRESGSHGCCQEPEEDENEHSFSDFLTDVSSLPDLYGRDGGETEDLFWKTLIAKYIGKDVNIGKSSEVITHDLRRLRRLAVTAFITVNLIFMCCLSVLYAFAGSDVICYCVAAIFSFSLVVQLLGLTCYKCSTFLKRYLLTKSSVFVTDTSKH